MRQNYGHLAIWECCWSIPKSPVQLLRGAPNGNDHTIGRLSLFAILQRTLQVVHAQTDHGLRSNCKPQREHTRNRDGCKLCKHSDRKAACIVATIACMQRN